MSKKPREFVFMCEHMGGTTWTVEHQWAIEGEAQEVVRCRDCKYAKTTLQGMPAERVLVCTAHLRDFPTSDDGFCHLGRRRDA